MALVLHAASDARVEQRPEPGPPGPGQVLLRVVRVGLCGTDATEYLAGPVLTPLRTRHPGSGVLGPVVLGHELVGVVEAVGAGVTALRPGRRVVCGAGVSCGRCPACRSGRTNLCERYWTVGLSADGGAAERVVVPAAVLHPVPDHVGDDDAALAQPLAVALHAVRRAGVGPDDVVVVNGAGAIGSFVVAGAVAAGARSVVALDVDTDRLRTARALGASHTVQVGDDDPREVLLELTDGALADVAVEASGVVGGVSAVQRLTRRGGRLLLVGLPKHPQPVDTTDLVLREIDVVTSVAHVCADDLPAAVDLLARRGLAGLLVERVVPLHDAVAGALVPLARGEARGKLLLDPTAVAP